MESKSKKEFHILVAGGERVGKTAFINRVLTGEFTEAYIPTISTDIVAADIRIDTGVITFVLYDVPEMAYNSFDLSILDGVIILYDATNLDVSARIASRYGLLFLERVFRLERTPKIPVLICATKSDLAPLRITPLKTDFIISAKTDNSDYQLPLLSIANYHRHSLCLQKVRQRKPERELCTAVARASRKSKLDYSEADAKIFEAHDEAFDTPADMWNLDATTIAERLSREFPNRTIFSAICSNHVKNFVYEDETVFQCSVGGTPLVLFAVKKGEDMERLAKQTGMNTLTISIIKN